MKYITVDGMISGTGIRDSVNSGYIDPDELGISNVLRNRISSWLERYKKAHYTQYKNLSEVEALDEEGIEICKLLKTEMPDSKVEYFSGAKAKRIYVI